MRYRPRGGWLHVIYGCMFSGKTEGLINEVVRARIARKEVIVFKAAIDCRYQDGETCIVSYSGAKFPATLIPVNDPEQILQHVSSQQLGGQQLDVVAIDEVQFFDAKIVDVIQNLLDKGLGVIAAGLNQNYRGEPFGAMPTILALADSLDQLYAVCHVCGEAFATKTQRLKADGTPAAIDEPLVLVGSTDFYQARCRRCHKIGPPLGAGTNKTRGNGVANGDGAGAANTSGATAAASAAATAEAATTATPDH
jgi:thymidine kinase